MAMSPRKMEAMGKNPGVKSNTFKNRVIKTGPTRKKSKNANKVKV